ncbi:extracellular solute-binding protein [Paenibacillus anaericanus]|uniref:Extracellular solute-binding protein n=1 Tax=Paenibacillus anaericanus TaxID=170367 RepID=A0A3S1BQS7_9BACL|nr:extracellular solute-binding protein [Paenibacillus anaericanus]RUT45284.1 extracellular solute-binding protein [Paenibacillus anaericanus]
MLKSKNKLSFVLATVMVLALLAGCGSNDTKGNVTSSNANKKSDKVVTIDFWSALDPSSEEGRTITKLVKEFDESRDDIDVKLQVISYDIMHDKLVAAFNAGDAPDISWGLAEWFGEFNKFDTLLDLTDYFNSWEEKDKFYGNVIDSLTIDGKLKALPNYLGIRALLYHEDTLKKAGYDAPPATWDELIAMGPVIKEKTGQEAYGIAGAGVRSPQELIMYLAQKDLVLAEQMSDGKYKNTWQDNPDQLTKAAEVFQFYQDLLSTGTIKSDAKTWGWEEEDQNFALDQYAMVVDGSWIETYGAEHPDEMADVKIAAPPYSDKAATFMEIAPLYMYKTKIDKTDATWEFAKFLLGAEYQSAVNLNEAPRTDVVSDSQWGKDFTALADSGVVFPSVSLGSITTAMQDALAKGMLKNDKPEDVAKWLSQAINDSLKKTDELSAD